MSIFFHVFSTLSDTEGLEYFFNLFEGQNQTKALNLQQFFIKQKLVKPKHKGMGSYTVKIKNKNYLFSGGIHLPYYFIVCY